MRILYVRFLQARSRCWLYGRLRRTDFLPVGDVKEDEVLERGYESEDSGDDCARGLEYAFASDSDGDCEDDEPRQGMELRGAELLDFL